MPTIPFTLPDLMGGLKEVKGSAWMDHEFLVLEFETLWLGEIPEDRHTVKVDPAALEDVYLRTGVLKDRLCLRPKSRELLEVVPGKHLGEVQLRVWRKYRSDVEDIVEQLIRRRTRA